MYSMKKITLSALLVTGLAIGGTGVASAATTTKPAVPVQKDPSSQLVTYAKTLIGTPYKNGGTTVKGFDASAFVQHVYKKVGVSLPRTTADLYKQGTVVTLKQVKPGDLLFFDTIDNKKKEINYVGIYVGENTFISVTTKKGVAVSSLDSYWKSKVVTVKHIAVK